MTVVEPTPRAAPRRGAPAPPESEPAASHQAGHAHGAPPEWATRQPGRLRQANQRRPWLAPAATGAALAVGTAYTAWQNPNADGLFPGCPLLELTGWDCPGCGGLRATHALTRGDLFGALDHNLFVAVGLPLAVGLWVFWLLRTLGVHRLGLPKVPAAAWWALGTVVLVFTVVRNIPGVGAFEYLNSFT